MNNDTLTDAAALLHRMADDPTTYDPDLLHAIANTLARLATHETAAETGQKS